MGYPPPLLATGLPSLRRDTKSRLPSTGCSPASSHWHTCATCASKGKKKKTNKPPETRKKKETGPSLFATESRRRRKREIYMVLGSFFSFPSKSLFLSLFKTQQAMQKTFSFP